MTGAEIEDTYAEAFRSYFSRVLITAAEPSLATMAASSATGYATSALGCGVEAGLDTAVPAGGTPDSRPGVLVQFHIWRKSPKMMYDTLLNRIGHCVLTSPTTAVFDATPKPFTRVELGSKLKYFGDGYEGEVTLGEREMVTIPIMGGEFLAERDVGMSRGVSGGNLWLMGRSTEATIEAARSCVKAISGIDGSITPFPGGICSSGSKVGADRYSFLANSTNHPYCPTIKDRVTDSMVPDGVSSIMEIVINGTNLKSVRRAMGVGIEAAMDCDGLVRISAGNFGGELGKYRIGLRDLLEV